MGVGRGEVGRDIEQRGERDREIGGRRSEKRKVLRKKSR